MKKKYNNKEEQSSILNEDAVVYQSSTTAKSNSVPSFVTEDYRIGMEQYDKKEYKAAETVFPNYLLHDYNRNQTTRSGNY